MFVVAKAAGSRSVSILFLFEKWRKNILRYSQFILKNASVTAAQTFPALAPYPALFSVPSDQKHLLIEAFKPLMSQEETGSFLLKAASRREYEYLCHYLKVNINLQSSASSFLWLTNPCKSSNVWSSTGRTEPKLEDRFHYRLKLLVIITPISTIWTGKCSR